jgi:phosphinothricin acetyltransferase
MVKIVRASPKDFLDIAKLDRFSWTENRNSEFIPDGEHAWRLWTEHAIVYCAKIDDKIVGAILAFPCISGIFCVHKVFVETKFRGQRIGTKLFKKLLKETDKSGVDCFLTVDPTNNSAISLYNNWGFTEKKYVKGYYRKDENRYVLLRKYRE